MSRKRGKNVFFCVFLLVKCRKSVKLNLYGIDRSLQNAFCGLSAECMLCFYHFRQEEDLLQNFPDVLRSFYPGSGFWLLHHAPDDPGVSSVLCVFPVKYDLRYGKYRIPYETSVIKLFADRPRRFGWSFFWRKFPDMILGVTGSFGAGKSTVREAFSAIGWHFFDADRVCHDIYNDRSGAFFAGIVDIWGRGILDGNGFIDRKLLSSKVFGCKMELDRLTALLYPELDRRLDEEIIFCRRNGINGAFEIPLLFEKNYRAHFDAVMTVWCEQSIRHRRLMDGRAFSADEIKKREARQMDPDLKLELADFAVINNGSKELLFRQIKDFTERGDLKNCHK